MQVSNEFRTRFYESWDGERQKALDVCLEEFLAQLARETNERKIVIAGKIGFLLGTTNEPETFLQRIEKEEI